MRRSCSCLPRTLLLVLLLLPLRVAAGADSARAPDNAAAIQAGMGRIIALLDASAYMKSVPAGEHVVLCYQLAQNREPTPEEFMVLSELYGGPGFTRSAVLATALRGTEAAATWAQCREFLARTKEKDFQGSAEIRAAADRLARTCASQVAGMLSATGPCAAPAASEEKAGAAPPVQNEEYNVYFGYLHSHSALSDGTGTPAQAYAHARDVGHLDYFSLTDHGELLALWPWDDKWRQLKDAAEAAYAPGQFVTLWGFEWSNPVLGHINVLNSTDMTNCLKEFSLPAFYHWLAGTPEAFGLFNHPGYFDSLGLELARLRRADAAVGQIVGIEVANEEESFDRYYYAGSWETPFSFWDEGNLKGWRLGPVIGQDNHGPNWGSRNPFRTAVLARELTREAIIDAYENRRFYATENTSLHLDFRCCGFPMGSTLQQMPRAFTVKAATAAGESFERIRLFRDGELLETRNVAGNPIEVTFSDPAYSGSAYYYVIVTENVDTDGNGRNDEAISAPIWLEGPPPAALSCGTLSMDTTGAAMKGGYGDWAVLLLALALLAMGRRVRASLRF